MIRKLKEIVNGFLAKVKEEHKELAEERILVCLAPDEPYEHCRNLNTDSPLGLKCDGCGCVLAFKTRSVESKCPLNKWEK